jgi:arsenate reductase
VIATLGLLLVIFSLARSGRGNLAPAAVGAYIGSAYFFTSSTSFANPAIDVGRMFSDTFAGIAPASVPAFVVVQLLGGVVGIAVIRALYPDLTPDEAAEIMLPQAEVLEDRASGQGGAMKIKLRWPAPPSDRGLGT